MKAKEFLMQYRNAKQEIARLERQIDELDDLLGNVTVDPTNEHVQSSKDPDKIGRLIAKKADIQEEIKEAKDIALDTMEKVLGAINMVKDERYKEILQARYIECKPWSKIVDGSYYDERYIFRLHKEALDNIDLIIMPCNNSLPECYY